jgi:hypothetical protein
MTNTLINAVKSDVVEMHRADRALVRTVGGMLAIAVLLAVAAVLTI